MPPGSYTVKVEARGFATERRPVTLGDAAVTLDVTLHRGGEVRVQATDEAGQPLAGARATLVDARGQPVTRTLSLASLVEGDLGLTDASGVAVIPDLPQGTYRVTARKDGYALDGVEPVVQVPAGGRADARLVLRSAAR
jgi:hypothetical protein